MADAAVVLLTPDDIVALRPDLVGDSDGADERERRGQARPNVYYEAGIADALGRERTVIVEVGGPKAFSDAAGRLTVRYDGSAAMRHTFAGRLRLAGLAVDTTGSNWLSAGDIAPAIDDAKAAIVEPDFPRTGAAVPKKEVVGRIGRLLADRDDMQSRSKHQDLSDLPDESLKFVVQAQALVDTFAPESPYETETAKVGTQLPHLRLPVLAAVLRALRAELAG